MSLSESFYWHDYETSGADPALDRPLQFAGVRTDTDLQIIGEPLVQFAAPTPDYLPHPGAIRVTGIKPSEALAQGLAEREFIALIHRELAMPGTCGVGYNSIRFDDEITRFALYRNFFDPYARERNEGRSRWDLIDVVRAQAALRPEGMVWPIRDDGALSFRLEHLTAANGIEHGDAHDALADVLATIALARQLKAAQPALFSTLYAARSSAALLPLLDPAGMRPVIYVSGILGGARHNLAVVVPLAFHPRSRNEIICADLASRPDFLDMSSEAMSALLFTSRSELPSGTERPPLISVKLNRAPVLLPMAWLRGEPAERLGLNGDSLRAHLKVLRSARDADPRGFTHRLQEVYRQHTFPPRTDVDTMLYEGFIGVHDSNQFQAIRDADGTELANRHWVFRDGRLPELLFRYRARNSPQNLTDEEWVQWQAHCRQQISAEPYDLAAFARELKLEMARLELTDRQRAALEDLADYARMRCRELGIAWREDNDGND